MQERLIMFPADEQEPSLQNRKLDVGTYQFIGDRGCPPLQCGDLTPPDKRVKCLLDQACGLREIGGGQSVVNGVVRQALLLIPYARAPVEFWYKRGMCALQAMAQRFSEELVVAIPAPLIIQRREEEIGLLYLLQHRLAACLCAMLADDGLTE